MDLIQITSNEQNRLLLQKQIAKDFLAVQCEFQEDFLTTIYSVESILSFIQEKLIETFERGERISLQLLYTIDIPEKDFLKVIGTENFQNKLSQMILEREAKKIYFRLKYS